MDDLSSLSESIEKTLYHPIEDRRHNLSDPNLPALVGPHLAAKGQEQAASVACITFAEYLKDVGNHEYQLNPTFIRTLSQVYTHTTPLHPSVPFSNEPVIGIGTAYLIDSDLALTARHCLMNALRLLNDTEIENLRLVFRLAQPPDGRWDLLRVRNVYQIKYIACLGDDWAVLKLHRRVDRLRPLVLSPNPDPPLGLEVYMLGHPQGLPLKFTRAGKIAGKVEDSLSKERLGVEIDAFRGNSGSPVFDNASQMVVGMLIRGQPDVTTQHASDGTPSTVLYRASSGKETCQKISEVVRQAILESQAEPGLSLIGSCPLSNRRVIIHKGFGMFRIGKECCTSICPCGCQNTAEDVNELLLTNCAYDYEGALPDWTRIKSVKTTSRQKGIEKINFYGYKFLNITARPLN